MCMVTCSVINLLMHCENNHIIFAVCHVIILTDRTKVFFSQLAIMNSTADYCVFIVKPF